MPTGLRWQQGRCLTQNDLHRFVLLGLGRCRRRISASRSLLFLFPRLPPGLSRFVDVLVVQVTAQHQDDISPVQAHEAFDLRHGDGPVLEALVHHGHGQDEEHHVPDHGPPARHPPGPIVGHVDDAADDEGRGDHGRAGELAEGHEVAPLAIVEDGVDRGGDVGGAVAEGQEGDAREALRQAHLEAEHLEARAEELFGGAAQYAEQDGEEEEQRGTQEDQEGAGGQRGVAVHDRGEDAVAVVAGPGEGALQIPGEGAVDGREVVETFARVGGKVSGLGGRVEVPFGRR
mmetsp:Transcript_30352/g.88744  ORF Transcript_30352/g.88744 Transcript_30352/m.88744 type:complete len:288 (-) Transcript_30352:33-896(-)